MTGILPYRFQQKYFCSYLFFLHFISCLSLAVSVRELGMKLGIKNGVNCFVVVEMTYPVDKWY